MRRLSKRLVLALVATAVAAGTAYGALDQVDPATVPQGFLVAQSQTPTSFKLKVDGARERHFPRGSEVTIQHVQFAPGDTSGWHSHAGPAFVQVVTGTLSVYEANDRKCAATQYPAGTGFLEPGFDDIHDARNEGTTAADVYVTYMLPPGSGEAGLYIPQPDNSNPRCPFAN